MIATRDYRKRRGEDQRFGSPLDQHGVHLRKPQVVAYFEANGADGIVDGDGVEDLRPSQNAE